MPRVQIERVAEGVAGRCVSHFRGAMNLSVEIGKRIAALPDGERKRRAARLLPSAIPLSLFHRARETRGLGMRLGIEFVERERACRVDLAADRDLLRVAEIEIPTGKIVFLTRDHHEHGKVSDIAEEIEGMGRGGDGKEQERRHRQQAPQKSQTDRHDRIPPLSRVVPAAGIELHLVEADRFPHAAMPNNIKISQASHLDHQFAKRRHGAFPAVLASSFL
jgi:hypothetical protein